MLGNGPDEVKAKLFLQKMILSHIFFLYVKVCVVKSDYRTFVFNLVCTANRIREKRNLSASQEVTDAIILAGADIVANAVPAGTLSRAPESIMLSRGVGAFLCLIVASLIMWTEKEKKGLPKNEILAASFLVLFQMHIRDTIAHLATEGVRRFQMLTRLSEEDKNVKHYLGELNATVYNFIMTSDDEFAEKFADLFTAILEYNEIMPS